MTEIVSGICDSDIVIADVSSRKPNVFYELGIAHSFGKPCIVLAKNGQKLEFDIRAYRHFFYRRSILGLESLRKKLPDAIDETLYGEIANPVVDALARPVFVPGCFKLRAIMWHLPWRGISIHVADCNGDRLRSTFPRGLAEQIRDDCVKIVTALLPRNSFDVSFAETEGISGPDDDAEADCSWDWVPRRIRAEKALDGIDIDFEIWERERRALVLVTPREGAIRPSISSSLRREVETEWLRRFAAQEDSLLRLLRTSFGRRAAKARLEKEPIVKVSSKERVELTWWWTVRDR